MPFGPDAFVIVVTHDHAVDQTLVERALARDCRYLAMIGSERKARLMRERAISKGFDEVRVAAVRSPAGLDIGAETPEEIAISIVAEMVQVRRQEAPADASTDAMAQKAS
jgi:xanthine dehydrogenase accessory factor